MGAKKALKGLRWCYYVACYCTTVVDTRGVDYDISCWYIKESNVGFFV